MTLDKDYRINQENLRVLKEAFDLFPDALLLVNSDSIILVANFKAINLFGYNAMELRGAPLSLLLPGQHTEDHSKYVKKYFSEGNNARKMGVGRQLKAKCREGKEIDVDITLSLIRKKHKLYSLAVIRDISERLQLEAQLTNLTTITQELEKFSYTVSHDLKAPLNHVKMLTQLILKEVPDKQNPMLNDYAEHLDNTLKTMDSLIHGILDYAKAGFHEKRYLIDLNEVLEEVLQNIEIPVNFHVKIESPLPGIHGNKTAFFQIFLNLITNAVKFNCKEEGVLVIEWFHSDGFYEFRFSDNGTIVPEEQRKIMFDTFNVLSDSKMDSHGLGLSIVRRIIEKAGGSIWYEESNMKGSSLVFKWPVLP